MIKKEPLNYFMDFQGIPFNLTKPIKPKIIRVLVLIPLMSIWLLVFCVPLFLFFGALELWNSLDEI